MSVYRYHDGKILKTYESNNSVALISREEGIRLGVGWSKSTYLTIPDLEYIITKEYASNVDIESKYAVYWGDVLLHQYAESTSLDELKRVLESIIKSK